MAAGRRRQQSERKRVYNLFPWNKCQRNLYLRWRAADTYSCNSAKSHTQSTAPAWVHFSHSLIFFLALFLSLSLGRLDALGFLSRSGSVFWRLASVEHKNSVEVFLLCLQPHRSTRRFLFTLLLLSPLSFFFFFVLHLLSVSICIKKVFGSRRRKMKCILMEPKIAATSSERASKWQTLKLSKLFEKWLEFAPLRSSHCAISRSQFILSEAAHQSHIENGKVNSQK